MTLAALVYFTLYTPLLPTELTPPFLQGVSRAGKHYRLHAKCIFKLFDILAFSSLSAPEFSADAKVHVHDFS